MYEWTFLGKISLQEIVIIYFSDISKEKQTVDTMLYDVIIPLFFTFFAENELLFRDSAGGLSILDLDNGNYTQIVSNTTFVSDTVG